MREEAIWRLRSVPIPYVREPVACSCKRRAILRSQYTAPCLVSAPLLPRDARPTGANHQPMRVNASPASVQALECFTRLPAPRKLKMPPAPAPAGRGCSQRGSGGHPGNSAGPQPRLPILAGDVAAPPARHSQRHPIPEFRRFAAGKWVQGRQGRPFGGIFSCRHMEKFGESAAPPAPFLSACPAVPSAPAQ